ncbi:MAG TPA: hypothetical protein VEX62_07400 [Candidatus Limnocylindrales bacterium]|nr:hypothetical protein [Candidatus Limnocylindrales bacterium]
MKVQLVTNPAGDANFRMAAERLLDDGAMNPAQLQRMLRSQYPSATVFGGIQEAGSERWYVYREGRWIDSSPAADMTAG